MAGIIHKRVVAPRDKGMAADWNDDHEQTGNHDVDQNQFLNQVIENKTDFPVGAVEGQIVWRTDLNRLYIFDGTNWQLFTREVDSCCCVLDSPQSFPNNTQLAISWDSELWDTNDMFDIAVNPERIYLKTPGFHQVNLRVTWDDNAAGRRFLIINVSGGAPTTYSMDEGGNTAGFGWFQEMSLTVRTTTPGAFIWINALQTSGGALNIKSGNPYTSIQVTYLGAE